MFYVIYGYCGPDNYTSDNGPILEVKVFKTKKQVEAFYKDWIDPDNFGFGSEDISNVTFMVIEGKQLEMVEKTKVTEWVLK